MENIKKEIIKKYEGYLKNFEKDIKEEKQKQDKQEHNYFEWILQRQLTNGAFKKWKSGELTNKEAIEKAIKRKAKQNEKEKEKTLQRLEAIQKSGNFTKINIIVEWVTSKTWRNESARDRRNMDE